MLLCNNTAIPAVCVIIRVVGLPQAVRPGWRRHIIGAMTNNADDLAHRYLALWSQYLTALLADPRAMDTLKHWLSVTAQFAYPAPGAAQQGGTPLPAWPPFFGPFGLGPMPPAAGAPATQADRIAEIARRVDELERRLAKLEQQPVSRRSRRGARASGP